jgi:hypothetical protein
MERDLVVRVEDIPQGVLNLHDHGGRVLFEDIRID